MMEGLDYLGANEPTGRVNTGAVLGTIVATIALALGWKAHRVIGGLLGFFIVGPIGGGSIGYLLSREDIAKLKEQKQLPTSAASAALPFGTRVKRAGAMGVVVVNPTSDFFKTDRPGTVWVRWDVNGVEEGNVDVTTLSRM